MKRLMCAAAFVLVVAPSVSAQSTISTAGADCSVATRCAVFDVRGVPSVGVYLNVGTSGTFNFEATLDNAIWFSITDDVGGVANVAADGAYYFTNPGYSKIRVRASAINGAATLTVVKGGANLRSTATLSGGGYASAANQDAQTALLTTIDSDTSRLTSSAASAAPAAPLASTTLTFCTYTAAGVTFANTQQGGLTCDSTGALRIAGSITAAASTTDADDGSIASGQTNDNVNALGMAYSGSAWSRLTFGSAGTASSQVWTVQGIASGTPLAVDISQIGGSTPPIATCDSPDVSSVAIDTATAGNVQLVALSGTTVVYVCGFNATSAADVSVQFVSGTGTACATGETNKTGLYQLSAASGAGIRGLTVGFGGATVFKGAAGEAVCIELSGAVQVDGILSYVQR